jgi:hypothetical protein
MFNVFVRTVILTPSTTGPLPPIGSHRIEVPLVHFSYRCFVIAVTASGNSLAVFQDVLEKKARLQRDLICHSCSGTTAIIQNTLKAYFALLCCLVGCHTDWIATEVTDCTRISVDVRQYMLTAQDEYNILKNVVFWDIKT